MSAMPAAVPAFSYVPAASGVTGAATAAPGMMSKLGIDSIQGAMDRYQQFNSIHNMIKPNGSLQQGDPQQVAGDIAGGLGKGGMEGMPEDVKKALMALVGGK
jgi:hypothetical protein